MTEPSGQNTRAQAMAQQLYQVLFFNIFSLNELNEIMAEERLIKWKKFAKGTKIFSEGAFDQHFYIPLRGEIEIKKTQDTDKEVSLGKIRKGEVFGEKVVCLPETPRRASAYVCSEEDAILCEIDGTMLDTVSKPIQIKFLKKFLDLLLDRLSEDEIKIKYFKEIIAYSEKNGFSEPNDYFFYSLETAIDTRNKLTLFIKYTNFLVAKKIDPDECGVILRELLVKAYTELDQSFGHCEHQD